MDADDVCAAWRSNTDVTLRLLELVSDADFDLKPGKGKTIRSNLTHLVSTRRMWCEDGLAAQAATVPKLDWKTATREDVVEGLRASDEVMVAWFRKKASRPGKSLARLFAYCVAHEAHHRCQIELALRLNGREPDDTALFRLWEWREVE